MNHPANVCGPRVRRLRVALGLTHVELSCLLAQWGVRLSPGQVAMVETRARRVRDHELLALAACLRTTVEVLVGRRRPPRT